MGVRIIVGEYEYEATGYVVSESATPLAANDSSGGVGEITFEIPVPDPDLQPDHPINRYTQGWLIGQNLRLTDTRYGFTLGEVTSADYNHMAGVVTVSCISRLGDLGDFNLQADPYIGTLRGAFEYYCELADVTVDVSVDDEVADRQVKIPGWHGEMWYHLKQLAIAQDCEISLVSGTILLRPIRGRNAEKGYTIQRSAAVGGNSLAQAVEVYWYKTRAITDELVYPPEGWNPEVEVLNVNAGETAEYTLELSASLSSIQEPEMRTSVSQGYSTSSVYTVVADDGLPVTPAQWRDFGGEVEVTLNPDTVSLTVSLTGAVGVPLATGGTSRSFSLALASATSGSRYSTLRIVGTGVSYSRESKRIRTGVPPEKTATDVGVTIDNIFINDLNSLYTAGTRAAVSFTGETPALTGTVSAINRRGEGEAPTISYGAVEDRLVLELGASPSYSAVQSWYASEGLGTYGAIQEWWDSISENEFARQAFGNVLGSRVWDPFSKRPYRIRSGTIDPEGIDFSIADDDLTHEDVEEYFEGRTYADVQNARDGLTYNQERLVGLRG